MEEEYPDLITPDSPTQRVSEAPVEGFVQVKHASPMLSMDNTYSHQELKDFDKRVRKNLKGKKYRYVVELKIDGASISLRFARRIAVSSVYINRNMEKVLKKILL